MTKSTVRIKHVAKRCQEEINKSIINVDTYLIQIQLTSVDTTNSL